MLLSRSWQEDHFTTEAPGGRIVQSTVIAWSPQGRECWVPINYRVQSWNIRSSHCQEVGGTVPARFFILSSTLRRHRGRWIATGEFHATKRSAQGLEKNPWWEGVGFRFGNLPNRIVAKWFIKTLLAVTPGSSAWGQGSLITELVAIEEPRCLHC